MSAGVHLVWLRSVPTRARGERPAPFKPVLTDEWKPPLPLHEAENGYAALMRIVSDWPAEGAYPPDLRHRRAALPGDRKTAERALLPLRPLLDRVPESLARARWQVPIPETGAYSELAPIKRLVRGLLLRADLEGREDDRAAAVEIARRLRGSDGPMISFLVGLALGKECESLGPELESEWREALRQDLVRLTVPEIARAKLPDERPSGDPEPLAWEARRLAVAWALRNHPRPYGPEETLRGLMEDHATLAQGRSPAVDSPWPRSMLTIVPGVPLAGLWQARAALLGTANPYGLYVRSLIASFAAQTHAAVVKARPPRA